VAKFLLGLLFGFVLTIVVVILVLFSFARFHSKPPEIASNSTLVLHLDGSVPERSPVEFPIPFLQQKSPLTVEQIWSLLRHAAADPKITAVVIEPAGLQVGWAKMQELRTDLLQFKKSGKPLYAYLKSPGSREYYVAMAADKVYMPPEDLLNLKGMRFELMYFKRTLDKVGVQVDVEHAGKYKDFGDMFTRTTATPETQEVMNGIIDDLYGDLIQTIATGRKQTPEQVRATIDNGPLQASQALKAGFVDELRYEDQMFGELKAALKQSALKKVGEREYSNVGDVAAMSGKKIALVVAQGDITRGDPETSTSENGIESESFNKLLQKVSDDATVKGVIVRIDSPGGESYASDELWRAMNQLSKKKPTVISMSDSAASGGYYMAMSGDPIVAYPGTLTGSIGVVFGKPNLHGLYDKLGIDKTTISRGHFATIDSDDKPLDEEARAKLREGIDANYRSFVTKVAASRKRKFEEIEPLAQGRVWMGDQAKGNGLVDELGGLDKAIEMVKQRAKIPASDKVALVTYPAKRNWFEIAFQQASPEALAQTVLETRMRSLLPPAANDPGLRLLMQGGMLRLLPFAVRFE
jgi:protease-4